MWYYDINFKISGPGNIEKTSYTMRVDICNECVQQGLKSKILTKLL
jgi:hypothetical protein